MYEFNVEAKKEQEKRVKTQKKESMDSLYSYFSKYYGTEYTTNTNFYNTTKPGTTVIIDDISSN